MSVFGGKNVDGPGATKGTNPHSINTAGEITGYYVDASSTFHGFIASEADSAPEPPTLTFAGSSVSVMAGGSVALGITASPVDVDDRVSVIVKGVPGFETITAGAGEIVTQKGSTYTVTATTPGASISDLTLNSFFKGKGHPVSHLSVTAANTTAGEAATTASQTLTATDPPASAPSLFHSVALLSQFLAAGFENDGAAGFHEHARTSPGVILAGEQGFLAPPHHS
jgi:hypothetical protein